MRFVKIVLNHAGFVFMIMLLIIDILSKQQFFVIQMPNDSDLFQASADICVEHNQFVKYLLDVEQVAEDVVKVVLRCKESEVRTNC